MADKQPTAAEMLAAAAPPPSSAGAARPLGVPADYQAPGTQPKYFDTDVFAPASLAPERIAQLQRRMVDAGLIPKNARYRNGVWDDVSREAYRGLLETANVYGVDEARALNIYAQSKPVGRDPLAPPVANPADIQATVRTAARALYGHKADDAMVQRIVAGFQAEQTRAAQPNATVEAPALNTYVNQQLETADPRAVTLDKGLDVGNTILQAFMNPAGTLDTGGAG